MIQTPSAGDGSRERVNGTPGAASVCGSDDGSVSGGGRRRVSHTRKPKGDCVVCKVNKGQSLLLLVVSRLQFESIGRSPYFWFS